MPFFNTTEEMLANLAVAIAGAGGGGGTVSSVNGQTGDVVITKTAIGLSNVENTSDVNKPISTATQTALDLKADITNVYNKTEIDTEISTLEASITSLETSKLSIDKLIAGNNITITSDDTSGEVTISSTGGGSANWGEIGGTLSNQTDLKAQLDLKANITDVNTSLDLKADKSTTYTKEEADNLINVKEDTITAGTTSQYFRGDKTWATLDKTAIGLSNVENTSDVNKPISTATQTALDLKANATTLFNFASFRRQLTGINIPVSAGSNTPSNLTDDIFASQTPPFGLNGTFSDVFTYSSGTLFVKNTIVHREIVFDVDIRASFNGGQNSQFEIRVVNASTSNKISAVQFQQSTNLQSTQPQKVGGIIRLRLGATSAGTHFLQTVGFRLQLINLSTSTGITLTGLDTTINMVSTYSTI